MTGVVWLYGRSAAGKTTLATALAASLRGEGRPVMLLDGDAVRASLNRDLGFDEAGRTENIRRIAEVARLGRDAGALVVCAAITPLRTHRALVRERLGDAVTLVHLACPLEVCVQRDPRGLYRRALAGDLPGFTGIGSEFEEPLAQERDIRLDTAGVSVDAALTTLRQAIRMSPSR